MSQESRSADLLLGLGGKGLTACRTHLEKLRQEQAESSHSKAQERILAIQMKKVEARIARLEADEPEANRLEEEERLRREDHARRYPVKRSFYAPMQGEYDPSIPVNLSPMGREQALADAQHCLNMLRVRGWDGGRRVGIAVRDIVGAAGNFHGAGDVVLFCDWEPDEMGMGMAPDTWVRPEGWDRLLVDTALPPEAIEGCVARRQRIFTHNMVYGVSGSSVVAVAVSPPAESIPSASWTSEFT